MDDDDDIATRTDHHLAVEAAFLHLKENCYFVGPFAQRVSFASQQIRALDLVSGLMSIRRDQMKAGLSIAVVGAGLAGMMAAAAFHGLKAKIHIFEANKEILSKHAAAPHRLIHPTIGRWPFEETLKHTSELPIFNWCAAPCDQVMAKIRSEWDRFFAPAPFDDETGVVHDFMIVHDARVKRIETPDDGSVQLFLKSARKGLTEDDGQVLTNYDLVVVATGYGQENVETPDGTLSYWEDDRLEREVETESDKDSHDNKRTFYVSGCGDGGLIDFLRIVHGDFRAGWLAITVAGALEGTAMAKTIRRAEYDALALARSVIIFEQTKTRLPGVRPPQANVSDDIVSKRLSPVYLAMARKLWSGGDPSDTPEDCDAYRRVNMILKASLEKIRMKGKAYLVSKLDAPFKAVAAPIHKLLVAHVMANDMRVYQKGTYVFDAASGTAMLEIGGRSNPVGGRDGVVIIPRHGSESEDQSLLEEDETRSLRLRQLMLADWVRSRTDDRFRYPVGYPNPRSPKDRMANIGFQFESVCTLFETLDDRYSLHVTDQGDFALQRVSRDDRPDKPDKPGDHCVCALGHDQGIALKLPETVFGCFTIKRPADGGVMAFGGMGRP